MYYFSREKERELIAIGQRLKHISPLDTEARKEAIEARNAVVLNVHNLCYKLASFYCRWDKKFVHDCANACVAKLIEKFDDFDLSVGCRFSTWAFQWIRQSCQLFFWENRSVIKGARNQQDTCEETQRKNKQANNCMQGSKTIAMHGKNAIRLQDTIHDVYSFEEEVERRDEIFAAKSIVSHICQHMDKKYGEILLRRAAGETLLEIGDSMGISKERVRQIERDAKAKFVEVAQRVAKPAYERLTRVAV
ncbi:MAG TPA: sigma-70 family RNA polymerase sigma factor [Gemmatales bacterium]|nr:sigma-70 family RNA polymerase sigma factor [Gemmatales bacterium]